MPSNQRFSLAMLVGLLCASCASAPPPPREAAELVELGERLFFEEPFDGNGRTCGTCHRREDNFGLSPAFIAELPDNDPLFVAEHRRALRDNFEKPAAMRRFGVILENQDGFDDMANNFNLRGVPHLLSMSVSVDSADGPRTGWSGDGAPGDGSLRSFTVGAIIQHFPKTLDRVAGVDFRLPTNIELDAIDAFLRSLGRTNDLQLPLPLTDSVARRGQEVFLDQRRGKCNVCHANAGANADENVFGLGAGNLTFNTGLPGRSGDPADDGFGNPGNGKFNTPPLVEAADTAPFFHNNTVETLEGAIAFYNTRTFNDSPAGRMLVERTGGPIALDGTSIAAVAAFLRVINALENIRISLVLLEEARSMANMDLDVWRVRLDQARHETEDAIEVLSEGGLHDAAVASLQESLNQIDSARKRRRPDSRVEHALRDAEAEHGQARAELIRVTRT